jgi:ribosomal protein L11 methyltransferase
MRKGIPVERKSMSFKIGRRFDIFRSTEVIEPGDRIPLVLGSGRAFGSGEHETTSSCLEEMEKIPLIPGAKVLDIGCGTGILSLAAAGMGAHEVIAFDPDPEAIKAIMNNLRLNRMRKKIIALEGELKIIKDRDFDVIIANLYGDLLVKMTGEIAARLKPGGYLLLSGILYEYAWDLKTGFGKIGFELLKARYLEEYVTLRFRKST